MRFRPAGLLARAGVVAYERAVVSRAPGKGDVVRLNYPAVSTDQRDARLTVRDRESDSRTEEQLWVKDGPILSQARSRSKGPLSDQVADATKPRGQVAVGSQAAVPDKICYQE